MNCPSCHSDDFYDGLTGPSCVNSRCQHYKPGNQTTGSNNAHSSRQLYPTPVVSYSAKTNTWSLFPDCKSQQDIAIEIYNKSNCSGRLELCGGAPRNWFQNKLANDLDFYLQTGWMSAETFLNNLGPDAKYNISNSWGQHPVYRRNNKISKVYEFEYKGMKCNLITFDYNSHMGPFHKQVWETFDFNICKFHYDFGVGGINCSPSAMDDLFNKTLTCSISNIIMYTGVNKLAARAAKMQSYYPDHKIVINP